MKKQLLIAICLLFSAIAAQASHLMGGQMTSRNIGGLTYEVTLTVYRDTLGIPVYTTANFYYSYASGGFDTSHIVPVSPVFVFGNGVERYTYTDTIALPFTGTYDMWYDDCCRNAAILNIPAPGSFHLANKLMADSTNSTPVFLNEPITLAQLGVPFAYNPLPFDVDGDSIAWMLDIPQEGNGTSLPSPVAGYVLPYSDTLVPFTMNPVTGEISFLPNTIGYFEVSMLVQEYRAGILIGEIRRDMQIIVVQSSNGPVNLTLNSPNAPFSGKNYSVDAGTAFNFTVIANDPDGNAVNIAANGDAFRLANPATFTSSTVGAVTTATLSWNTSTANERNAPYIIGLRVNETYTNFSFSSDISIHLNVNKATGLNNPTSNGVKFNVYPNPTSDYMMLNFTSKSNSDGRVEILNLAGQLVKTYDAIKVLNGLNVIQVNDLNLNQGVYIVNLIQDGKNLGNSKLNIR